MQLSHKSDYWENVATPFSPGKGPWPPNRSGFTVREEKVKPGCRRAVFQGLLIAPFIQEFSNVINAQRVYTGLTGHAFLRVFTDLLIIH